MENVLDSQGFMLSELKPGQSVRILSLHRLPTAYRQRLISLGMTQGRVITLIRKAPLGCPLEFACGPALVCVRAHEVAGIAVTAVSVN